jgi:hypothetical protein
MGPRDQNQKVSDKQEESSIEEQQPTQVIEVAIDLELINNKLNHLISRTAVMEQTLKEILEKKY